MKLIEAHPETDPRDAYIAAMWLMFFFRAPRNETAPGEPVDLGEIGSVRENNWQKERRTRWRYHDEKMFHIFGVEDF